MVLRSRRGLVGELASWKARNLEQVGVSGDGGTSESIDDTLKTTAAASLRTSVRGKTATETPRAEGPGNRVHDG
jgi:hypothetical protein